MSEFGKLQLTNFMKGLNISSDDYKLGITQKSNKDKVDALYKNYEITIIYYGTDKYKHKTKFGCFVNNEELGTVNDCNEFKTKFKNKYEIDILHKYVVYLQIYDLSNKKAYEGYYNGSSGFVEDPYKAIKFDSKEEANQLIKEYNELTDICIVLHHRVEKI